MGTLRERFYNVKLLAGNGFFLIERQKVQSVQSVQLFTICK